MVSLRFALLWLALPVMVGLAVALDPLIGDSIAPEMRRQFGSDGLPLPLLPLAALGLGGGVLAVRALRRVRDFTLCAMLALLMASQLNGFGLGPLDVFDFTLFGVFLAWAASLALDSERPVRIGFLTGMAFLIGVLAVAHLPVMRPMSWVVGMIGVGRILLIALLVGDLCRDVATVQRVIRLFIIVAVISALIGIAQFFLALTGIWVFTLIDPPATAFKPTPVGFVMRASGLCITAQHFSSFLVYALPFALWQLSLHVTAARVLAVLVLLGGVLVSWNTGAIFVAALVIGVFPFLRWPERAAGFAVILFGLLALAWFSGLFLAVYDLTFGDAGVAKGVDQRKTLFELGLEQVAANPFVGSGLHGFGSVDGNFWHRPVHNIFAQATAELGVLGLAAVLALFIVPLVALTTGLFAADTHPLRCAGLIALLTALLLGQSEPNLDHSNLWLLLALLQAIILTTGRPQSDVETLPK